MNNLKRIKKGVYEFTHNGQKLTVKKEFIQAFNKKRSNVTSLFVGWSVDGFNTYKTLSEFKKAYNL